MKKSKKKKVGAGAQNNYKEMGDVDHEFGRNWSVFLNIM